MEPSVIARITRTLGAAPMAWRPSCDRGCTANRRWIVWLGDDRSVFVKEAVDEHTAEWLNKEYFVYSRISGSFMPRLMGWCEDGQWPLLIIEDLHLAHWPPPWTPEHIKAVRDALNDLATVPLTAELKAVLPQAEESLKKWPGWHTVAEDPAPFLRLGLCTTQWLDRHLPDLIKASAAAPLAGDSILHMDTRSDNLCLRDGKAKLIDWNWARIGNPLLDIAGWLSSLHAEGGPMPDEILPDGAAELAALLSGYWASQSGLPPIPTAPRVRPLQWMQLQVAFPWTVRALGLTPPEPVFSYDPHEDIARMRQTKEAL